jgi:hypothetical protein
MKHAHASSNLDRLRQRVVALLRAAESPEAETAFQQVLDELPSPPERLMWPACEVTLTRRTFGETDFRQLYTYAVKAGASFIGMRHDTDSGRIFINVQYGSQVTDIDTGVVWTTDGSFRIDVRELPGELPLSRIQRTSPL